MLAARILKFKWKWKLYTYNYQLFLYFWIMKISVPPSKIMKEYFFLPLLPPPPRYRFRPFLLFKKEGNPPHRFHKGEGGGHYFKLMRQISVKYICIYIKFSMYKMNFNVTIKVCVYYLYFCHQYNNFKKLSKMFFIVPKRLLLPSRFFKL